MLPRYKHISPLQPCQLISQRVFNSCCGESWGSVYESVIELVNNENNFDDHTLMRKAIFDTGAPHLVNINSLKSDFFKVFTPLVGARCFICVSETCFGQIWLSRPLFLDRFRRSKVLRTHKIILFLMICRRMRASKGCHTQIRRHA